MSDDLDIKPFYIEIAKQGRAACKKCKEKCVVNELKIAKLVPNPFGDGKMKTWYHVECLFDQFLKQRPTTSRITSPDDIDGWNQLDNNHKALVIQRLENCTAELCKKFNIKELPNVTSKKHENTAKADNNEDGLLFRDFRKLVADITNVNSYLEKTSIAKKMFYEGMFWPLLLPF